MTEHEQTLPRVTELFAVIKSAHDELEQIRKDCPHPSYTVGWWEWRIGSIHAQRICDRCGDTVDGITEEERLSLGPFSRTPIVLTFDNPEVPTSCAVSAITDAQKLGTIKPSVSFDREFQPLNITDGEDAADWVRRQREE